MERSFGLRWSLLLQQSLADGDIGLVSQSQCFFRRRFGLRNPLQLFDAPGQLTAANQSDAKIITTVNFVFRQAAPGCKRFDSASVVALLHLHQSAQQLALACQFWRELFEIGRASCRERVEASM